MEEKNIFKENCMRIFLLRHFLLLFAGIISLGFMAMPTFAQDADKMHDMQRVIDAQQKHLEVQQKQLDEQRQLLQDLQKQMESLARKEETKEVPAVAQKPAATPTAKTVISSDNVVTSDVDRVKLSISGWVNPAVNVVDDGKDTNAYFVDNDNAESRVHFAGTGKINDDLTLGAVIELSIAPNRAGFVSQNDPNPGDVFEQRITEATLDSKRLVELSLGRGFTASYHTAGSDLSKTLMISYNNVSDLAGGMLFRQKSDDSLTDLDIAHSFISFDGLGRQSRVRYDTPTFNGFTFATSLLTDQRYDGAARWSGQGYGFKSAVSAGVADPKINDDTNLIYSGSFALLHENTGLNFTFAAGMLDQDNRSNRRNYYGKLGWITNFFSVGETAFAVDYSRTEYQPAESDQGYSTSLAGVQYFEKYGVAAYLIYRKYSLDLTAEPEVHDINVMSGGAMVMF